jgi:hypothetical protein
MDDKAVAEKYEKCSEAYWREVKRADDLHAEVKRLRSGIEKALATPGARAYILEHTLKNGADNCCEGRCQGHGTAEEGQPIKPLEAYHAEMLRYQGRMVKTAKSFLELDAYKEAAECLIIAEGMKFTIGRIPKEPV